GRMLATYVVTIAGVLAVLVATLAGGFGAGWAFLPPLPFYPAGQWSVWSESFFFFANLLAVADSACSASTCSSKQPIRTAALFVPSAGTTYVGARRRRRHRRRSPRPWLRSTG